MRGMSQGKRTLSVEQAAHLARIVGAMLEAEKAHAPEGERVSQAQIAKRIGISQSHLSQLARPDRARNAGIYTLTKLRDYLGMTIDDLIGLPPLKRTGGIIGATDQWVAANASAQSDLITRIREMLREEVGAQLAAQTPPRRPRR